MSLAFVAVLAACGSGGPTSQSASPPASSVATATTAEVAEAPEVAEVVEVPEVTFPPPVIGTAGPVAVPPSPVAVLPGASPNVPSALTAAPAALALVRRGEELLGVAPGEAALWTLPHAVGALDGSAVAMTSSTADATTLAVYDTETGVRSGMWTLAPDLHLAAVAPGGRWLSLTRPIGPRTEVVVVDARHATTATLQVPGRVEPEAFSTDGSRLFAIVYQPDGLYRVHTLNLATGEYWETTDRFKGNLGEEMSGVPVRAALNGNLLSTLYRVPGHVEHPAFVHTLNLTDGFSHCADLPQPFGLGAVGTDAISNSADGKQLFVASGGAYATIQIDAVLRPAENESDLVPMFISQTPPVDPAALTPGGAVWTKTGLITVTADTVTMGTRTTTVGPGAILVAARG